MILLVTVLGTLLITYVLWNKLNKINTTVANVATQNQIQEDKLNDLPETGNTIDTIEENDPTYTASAAFGIEVENVENWDEAYNWGNHADILQMVMMAGIIYMDLSLMMQIQLILLLENYLVYLIQNLVLIQEN